jgi:hypothetical protein
MAVCLLATGAARAAEAPLRWKFKPGDTLDYVLERASDGKLSVCGADLAIKISMTFDTSWKVKSVAADGTGSLEQTVDRIQINMSSPLAGELNYDSKQADVPNNPLWSQMEPVVSGMLGQTFQLKISPLGKVSDITLPEKLTALFTKQSQGGNRQQGMGIGNNPFSERGIKELLEKAVLPLPEAVPGKDVTWQQHFETPIPRIGTQMSDITFSYAGKEKLDGKELAKISAVTELTFEPAEDAAADLEITAQESKATYFFDTATGRMIKSDATAMSAMELSGPRELTQEFKDTVSMRQGKSPDKPVTKEKGK